MDYDKSEEPKVIEPEVRVHPVYAHGELHFMDAESGELVMKVTNVEPFPKHIRDLISDVELDTELHTLETKFIRALMYVAEENIEEAEQRLEECRTSMSALRSEMRRRSMRLLPEIEDWYVEQGGVLPDARILNDNSKIHLIEEGGSE